MKTKTFLALALSLSCTYLSLSGSPAGQEEGTNTKPEKYVAFSTDKEAYFMPRGFEHFQGVYSKQIISVCDQYNVPFTWLVVVDKDHIEVDRVATDIFSKRRHIDEFSLHSHFKWFIMDDADDFKSFKIKERRLQWLADAKTAIDKAGLPLPKSFRYGGGDSQDSIYYIQDLITLVDEFGVRNFLFSPERLQGVIGINQYEHKGNNVWMIEGGREITLLSTCVYLDEDEKTIISSIKKRLDSANYAIIGSHDYRQDVPGHMSMAIDYLNARYDIKYVTIDQIGELVRHGKIRNEW